MLTQIGFKTEPKDNIYVYSIFINYLIILSMNIKLFRYTLLYLIQEYVIFFAVFLIKFNYYFVNILLFSSIYDFRVSFFQLSSLDVDYFLLFYFNFFSILLFVSIMFSPSIFTLHLGLQHSILTLLILKTTYELILHLLHIGTYLPSPEKNP